MTKKKRLLCCTIYTGAEGGIISQLGSILFLEAPVVDFGFIQKIFIIIYQP